MTRTLLKLFKQETTRFPNFSWWISSKEFTLIDARTLSSLYKRVPRCYGNISFTLTSRRQER